MGRVERDREIARKRKRREKLAKLRTAYGKANSSQKTEILAKARKVSAFVTFE